MPWTPNQRDRRSRRMEWSMVSKAAERSCTQKLIDMLTVFNEDYSRLGQLHHRCSGHMWASGWKNSFGPFVYLGSTFATYSFLQPAYLYKDYYSLAQLHHRSSMPVQASGVASRSLWGNCSWNNLAEKWLLTWAAQKLIDMLTVLYTCVWLYSR